MFLFSKAVVRGMVRRKRGVLLNVGSLAGKRLLEVPVHYATAKAGIFGLTYAAAHDLGPLGITVNCVSPGIIATAEIRQHLEKQAKRRGEPTDWASLQESASREFMPNPTGIIADPEDIGHLVAFLASDKARYINAANLRIDGGAADSTH